MDSIRKAGYKLTPQRRAVYELIRSCGCLMSADEISKALGGSVNLVSVYRTLKLFEKIGLVFREKTEGVNRYYIDAIQHHHIVCRECGYTRCLPCSHSFGNIKGFSDISHTLVLTGLCNRCAGK